MTSTRISAKTKTRITRSSDIARGFILMRLVCVRRKLGKAWRQETSVGSFAWTRCVRTFESTLESFMAKNGMGANHAHCRNLPTNSVENMLRPFHLRKARAPLPSSGPYSAMTVACDQEGAYES